MRIWIRITLGLAVILQLHQGTTQTTTAGEDRNQATRTAPSYEPNNNAIPDGSLRSYISRISVTANGTQGTAASIAPNLSATGRYIVFLSDDDALVADDGNGRRDLFVYDLVEQDLERLPLASVDLSAGSSVPAISQEGRFVIFSGRADGSRCVSDILLYDRERGETERLSPICEDEHRLAYAAEPVVSADGRFTVYVQGNALARHSLALYDHTAGTTQTIQVWDGNEQREFAHPALSADSNFVAFAHAGGAGAWQIFLYHRVSGSVERISSSASGGPGKGSSLHPGVSSGGRYVVYESDASNLVEDVTPHFSAIYLYDRVERTATLISRASDGALPNARSIMPSISGDGRFIAFYSLADNLVPGDESDTWNLFLYDQATETTKRIARIPDLGIENVSTAFSADGRFLVRSSVENDLVEGDSNGVEDVFLYDLSTEVPPDPFLALPFDYSAYGSFADAVKDSEIGGTINSYFDHAYPTYTSGPNSRKQGTVTFSGYDSGNPADRPGYGLSYDGHDGIDFRISAGEKVLAAADGEIIAINQGGCLGNHVIVAHANGYKSVYGHMSRFAKGLRPGVPVTQGTPLGTVGSTGCSTGPHLHFTVLNHAELPVDPFGWQPDPGSSYGAEVEADPWQTFAASQPQPQNATSHYLWIHGLSETEKTEMEIMVSPAVAAVP